MYDRKPQPLVLRQSARMYWRAREWVVEVWMSCLKWLCVRSVEMRVNMLVCFTTIQWLMYDRKPQPLVLRHSARMYWRAWEWVVEVWKSCSMWLCVRSVEMWVNMLVYFTTIEWLGDDRKPHPLVLRHCARMYWRAWEWVVEVWMSCLMWLVVEKCWNVS